MKIWERVCEFSLLAVLCFFSSTLWAQEGPVPITSNPTPSEKHPQQVDWEQALIEGNINISKWLDSFADGLDLFLVGKRVTQRPNETRVNIETSIVSTEKEALFSTGNIGFNLRLPNVEDYWNVKFSSYDEQEDQRNLKNAYLRTTPREKNYGATVGLMGKLGDVRTRFEPRIELQDPLKVSHSLSFESVAKVGRFEVNPELEFYANSSVGLGSAQGLNFHYQINHIYSITQANQGDYEEKSHFYNVDNALSFGQVIDSSSAISYNLIFTSNNRPNYHLEAYNISISYSKVLYRNILDIQFIPNVDFAEDDGFHGVAGITVNINLQF